MFWNRLLIVLPLAVACFWVGAVKAAAEPADDVAGRFFEALPGIWEGRAIETPVGPVDYPVRFHVCDQGVVAGVAELKLSDHHWYFHHSGEGLKLTFLSTFRGNQEPVELVANETAGNTIWFHAPALPLLTLSVALAEPHIDIRVFHHQQPHVAIRLTRSDGHSTRTERSLNKTGSCRKPG